MEQGKSILYIACTLDGYIAGENDDLSFLSLVEKPGDDYYGYGSFIKTIDTIILGKTTYDWINKNVPDFMYDNKETYVITHSDLNTGKDIQENVKSYSGDLELLVRRLISENKRIFIEGGSMIIEQLLKNQLIDEFYIAIVPVILGKGTPLFVKSDYAELRLRLIEVNKYDTGLVQLHYEKW